jgi:multidrug resistance efflux pump
MNQISSLAVGGATSPRLDDDPASALAPAADAETWAVFAAAASDEAFLSAWLALQCGMIPHVRAGLLLLRESPDGSFAPAAVWPAAREDLTYLTRAAERALTERRGLVLAAGASDAPHVALGSVHVAYPVERDSELMGAVVLDLRARPDSELQAVMRQLLWGAGWLVALLRKHRLARDQRLLERAATALDLVQAAQEHATLDEAAMAVVNEMATLLKADRVSLGIEKKGRLRLRAISRTAWFDRKSQLVETIENAMEEALDQQATVAWPRCAPGRTRVSVAQRDLAVRAGSAAVLSVPLTSGGQSVGALTLERDQGAPFDEGSISVCEAAGELLGPAFASLLEHERWMSGRLLRLAGDGTRRLVGPRRPALKLSALLVLIAVGFLIFADGEFRVSARTFVEGEIQRAAVAPFDGYIAEAYARAGETVRAGAVLATLDDRELKLERVRWLAEKEQADRKYNDALARHERAAAQILAAQRDQVSAQLALAEEKLARAQLVAPFDAVVVAGDLSQMLGAPVEKGKVLFELAPLDSYRVVLRVDERDISYVTVGQRGELGLTGLTGVTLPFTVKSVTPVSTAQEGRNFFRVEAELEDSSARLRPGMEGVGKIAVDERRIVWIWTRNFVNWLRTSLWAWLP